MTRVARWLFWANGSVPGAGGSINSELVRVHQACVLISIEAVGQRTTVVSPLAVETTYVEIDGRVPCG